ncbi:MAG TPA: mersacidin/lichenicidin family type 2 lantibiotic [Ktedonosporobacter sp.]|nr:mersacidin/lichenicidin family type 2 lantibiotic [Ktedonosporobacter sp.]
MAVDIVRVWTDETYRRNLHQDELAHVPASPVGEVERLDADISFLNNDPASSQVTVCLTWGPCCSPSEINMTFGPCCW